nr:NAD(P)H-hydrate epimerase [Halogeometricum borinquense]
MENAGRAFAATLRETAVDTERDGRFVVLAGNGGNGGGGLCAARLSVFHEASIVVSDSRTTRRSMVQTASTSGESIKYI